jgi:hypothetical protein
MAGCAKSIAPELSDSFSTKVGDQVVTSQGSGVLLDLDRSKARPFYLLLETGKKKWFRKRDVTKPHDGVQIEVSMLKLVGKYVWYRSKEVWARAKVLQGACSGIAAASRFAVRATPRAMAMDSLAHSVGIWWW